SAARTATRPGSSTTSTPAGTRWRRSEEHTSELQSLTNLVCRLLLEKRLPLLKWRSFRVSLRSDPFCQRSTLGFIHLSRGRASPAARTDNEVRSKPPDQFFFNDTATTEIYTLSLLDALPI